MLFNTLRAEWTKLTSTRSFWWTSAIFLIFAWGWAILTAKLADTVPGGAATVTPESTLGVLFALAMPVLLIQAIMVVTTEYRYKMQANVYMTNPRRWVVALVKLLMYAVVAAVLVVLGVVGAYVFTELVGSQAVKDNFNPWDSDFGTRQLWVYPLAMAMLTLFGQGLGLLLRQTAGTVAISLILYLGIDNLVSMIPKIGEKIIHFMPFTALNRWVSDAHSPDAPWDSATGDALVFVAWAAVLWLLGVFFLHKRDA